MTRKRTQATPATTDAVVEPPKKKPSGDKRAKVAEELASEIENVRNSLHEMITSYRLKLDSELLQLAEAARRNGSAADSAPRLNTKVAHQMLRDLRALDVKPHKGRAKDFQRLQRAIEELIEQLPAPK